MNDIWLANYTKVSVRNLNNLSPIAGLGSIVEIRLNILLGPVVVLRC